ncbi:KRAB domain-containing protein 4-like [Protopterus annectens]|uniref:KRAB domain-containing protein 4-like n=1 Tax=Protopterus annectens TaxID=7888 RepID=UPI001CFAD7D7|nr:KRAB domain-containing protein 4-like [Protopterus annectens]
MKLEVPNTFEDVAVEFSGEEWKMLSEQEKDLHREVMVQNYENMISVGYNIPLQSLWLLLGRAEDVPSIDKERAELLQKEKLPDGTMTSK